MERIKFKKINIQFVKKEYPILYRSLEPIGLSDLQKEQVAGLVIEILQTVDIFPDFFNDSELYEYV